MMAKKQERKLDGTDVTDEAEKEADPSSSTKPNDENQPEGTGTDANDSVPNELIENEFKVT